MPLSSITSLPRSASDLRPSPGSSAQGVGLLLLAPDPETSRYAFLFDTKSANSAVCRSDLESVALAGLQPGLVFYIDFYCHDPPMLADLAVPNETQRLVGGQCSVVQEAGGHCRGIFRISLDCAAAHLGD